MRPFPVYFKTIIALLVGVFACMLSHAQLAELEASKANWTTVGEVKWLSNTKASLKYLAGRSDTTYLLYLQDDQKLQNNRGMNVTQYFSISYSGIDNTTGRLYEQLSAFFLPENRKNKKLEKIFKLGDELVHVQHYPKLTAPAILFSTKKNHIVFTQKDLDKLFNR
ncbi:hypothetical protein [Pseudocnuella soli]|uniref:hypothetical protein n=1 Tax=Pseudocnuella soli TaxID=2502779 RepID=UPI00104E55FF|nr:hypothetical protein [Pseudocnuella soli]